MEHAGIHRTPPPRTLGPRRKLPPGCCRGPGCPSSRREAELSAAAAQAQLESAPPSPAPPTSAGGEGENIENLSLSANKSMQSQAPGKPAPFPSLRAAGRSRGCSDSSGPQEIIVELLSRGSEALRMENKPAVCTFWVCLVQYKWNRVGCSDTASTSPISGRRR